MFLHRDTLKYYSSAAVEVVQLEHQEMVVVEAAAPEPSADTQMTLILELMETQVYQDGFG
ncbi:MAG: hypothetical protein MK034_03590 [Dehalococcoidia bacterium]|nr:hypothetical protein [Dehalococcoidia bacterium]